MNKVYIVINYRSFEDNDILAVFSNKTVADLCAEELNQKYKFKYSGVGVEEKDLHHDAFDYAELLREIQA